MKRKILFVLVTALSLFVFACTIKVTGVSVTGKTEMVVGEEQTLTAVVSPDNVKNKNVTWKSDAESVATVTNGVVKAVSAGTATITAKSSEDSSKSGTITITVTAVTANISVDSITIHHSKDTIEIGEKLALTITILPADATNKEVTWTSSNPSVATVNGGEVTGVSSGTTVITVKAHNDVKATLTIQVGTVAMSASELKAKIQDAFATYDNSSIGSAKMTVKNGDEVSSLELVYDYNLTNKTVNKLKLINTNVATNELYVVDNICYMTSNGVKESYEMDSYEMADLVNGTTFKKYFTNVLPFVSDASFFSNLSYELSADFVSKDDGVFVYDLNIAAYDGTALNLVGAEKITITVCLVGGVVKSVEYKAIVLGKQKTILVDFLGLVANVNAPSGY